MTEQKTPRDQLAVLFRDVVLILGGVFAVQGTDDETIERVAKGLECAYRRARGRTDRPASTGPNLAPHPAISALLRMTDQQGAEP